jgi:hypothetical protein
MAQNAGIEVAGLREFQKGLKQLSPEIDKELKTELKAVAEAIVPDARRRLPSRTGRASGSIRAGADAKGPYIVGGKKAVPYYGWLDFGSRNPRSGQPRRVGPWTKSGAGPKKGRAIYPAIDANTDTIITGAVAALNKAKNVVDLQ